MIKNIPPWVLEPTEADLVRFFGTQTYERGRDYAAQDRVGSILSAEKLISAQVRGSGYRSYRVSVVRESQAHTLTSRCACPIGHACKHAAALLIHVRTSQGRRTVPHWRRALDPVVQVSASGPDGIRLALQVDDDGHGPGLTPLRWGKERWIRTGASWSDLKLTREGIDRTQLELVNALRAAHRSDLHYGTPARLPLRSLPPDMWALLRQAVAAGIELLPGEGPHRTRLPVPELLEIPAELTFAVDGTQDGVTLTPELRVDGETFPFTWQNLLGNPAHGVAVRTRERFLLAPLTHTLSQSEQTLFSSGGMQIPSHDVGIFATGYLPRLREQFEVVVAEDVTLPEAQPPLLRCTVTFDGYSALVQWGFRYLLDDRPHDLALHPTGSEAPLRDRVAEQELAGSIRPGPWRGVDGRGLPVLHEASLTGLPLITFVDDVLPALEERDDVVVETGSEAPTFTHADEAPTISLSIEDSAKGDWFDLAVDVTVAGEKVPFAPLFQALAAGRDHLILDSGTWFMLDAPELEQLRALIEEARVLVDNDGDTFQLRPEHAGLWEELVELGVVAQQSSAWQSAVGALLDHTELDHVEPPAGVNATLRPYQREGFAWLSFLWKTRLGGVLADEMGLGKTLQSLAMAQAALEAGELDRPLLVVAPTSVLGTWEAEAARFTPDLKVVTITGTDKRRGVPLADTVDGAHIVLTSYTLLRLEADAYLDLTWSAVLLDEAQFVKNSSSKAYQAVRRLRARVKIALTGTPLENNLMDLWSLLSITAPGLFPDPKRFAELYRKPIEGGDSDALARLHRRIRPLMLRRTKAAVATELPDKQEQVVPVPLSSAHRKLYDRHLTRERQKVLGLVGDMNRNRITILRSLTLLRQLSLAPSLVDPTYPAVSAKIDALLELMEEATSTGHRALVFSQFTGFLALVKQRLTEEGVAYEYLDGRTRNRAERIRSFREGDAPVFLISLKAGGFGLTLTEADYVFILDPWWNPAAETQAIDRAHRIGQDKPVNVYRLVSADTIEEKVVALQERKRDLFDAVVGQTSNISAPLSAEDIRGLLEPDEPAAG
ncbi:DEAD/DEAH box helicase [Tessaracoccus antarcticus]|uniref:Helicase SNF2 n=1 Tax=Tessaracoccus antarcticus TaxID=2479848 RepID=A0A3M0GBJ0_9ACTN|nr:DEAD/DEAH box helicase [Tessaracoccus antarcticus]RMB62411.1 helicase SNF2 [Tessaracoccus antarcticus]